MTEYPHIAGIEKITTKRCFAKFIALKVNVLYGFKQFDFAFDWTKAVEFH